MTTTGTPTVTSISKTGTLPSGVTFVDNGNGTATLSGTPDAGTAGTYPLTITASNGLAPDAVQPFTLTIIPANAGSGKLVFTSSYGGPPFCEVMNSDGSFRKLLDTTTFTTSCDYPDWSPDGSKIVFIGYGPQIYVMNANGTGIIKLTDLPGSALSPKWSPDGTKILFEESTAIPNTNNIFVMNADGSNVTQLTFSDGLNDLVSREPAWSPNGSKIAYTSIYRDFLSNIHGEIWTMNADGSGKTQLTVADPTTLNCCVYYPDDQPAWSGDGSKIAFTSLSNTAIFAINSNGTGRTQLTGVGGLGGHNNSYPAWSPDSTKIAVDDYDGVFYRNIYIINADGSNPTNLTNNPAGSYSLHASWHAGTVIEAPSFTSANAAAFKVGTSDSFNITTVGNPTITSITKTGALPNGINFTDNGNGTAVIWGVPAQGTAGVYPITIKASNGINPDASQSFTLTVNEAPIITSSNSTVFKVGSSGTFTVTTTGSPTAAITRTGALPTGVNFVDNNNGTATLSGTPASGTAGSYPLSIKASNGILPDATQSFTLTVNQSPAITSANATTFQVGVAGTFTVTTTGAPTAGSITKTGSLPSGVTFTNNGDGTATIAGTPDPATDGSYPISITASNGIAPDATQNFTLTVSAATPPKKVRGQTTSE